MSKRTVNISVEPTHTRGYYRAAVRIDGVLTDTKLVHGRRDEYEAFREKTLAMPRERLLAMIVETRANRKQRVEYLERELREARAEVATLERAESRVEAEEVERG